VARKRMPSISGIRMQRHDDLISWLKADNSPECQDVAHRVAGCRVGTFAKDCIPLYTTEGKLDYIGSTISCDKHLCVLCGTEKAYNLRNRYLELVERNWGLGTHVHFIPTIQHELGDNWIELKSILKFIWKGVYKLNWWKKSVLGFIRNDDTCHLATGFHMHQHNIITLRPGIDVAAFSDKIQKYYIKIAAKFRYKIDWDSEKGWWNPITDQTGLYKAINYATKGVHWEKFENGEESGARTGASAFAEVWNSCYDHHWHSASGIWREAKSLTPPPKKPQRKPTFGINKRTWLCMSPDMRRKVRSCIGKPDGLQTVQALLGDGVVSFPGLLQSNDAGRSNGKRNSKRNGKSKAKVKVKVKAKGAKSRNRHT